MNDPFDPRTSRRPAVRSRFNAMRPPAAPRPKRTVNRGLEKTLLIARWNRSGRPSITSEMPDPADLPFSGRADRAQLIERTWRCCDVPPQDREAHRLPTAGQVHSAPVGSRGVDGDVAVPFQHSPVDAAKARTWSSRISSGVAKNAECIGLRTKYSSGLGSS